MHRQIYLIQMRSLRSALEHIQTLDLEDMEKMSVSFGSPAERALIASVRAYLATLPFPIV